MDESLSITPEDVELLLNECMYKPNSDIANILPISSISQYYSFDYNEIQKHKDQISHLFSQLYDGGIKRKLHMLFFEKDGRVWTRSVKTVDGLIGLGLANGDIEFYYPRELWERLPNKEPVILFKKEKSLELSSETLTAVYNGCIIKPGMNIDDITLLRVEGVSDDYIFDLDKIKKYTPVIRSFIREFGITSDGEQFGYFYNKRNGEQWTKKKEDVERLIALGLSIGLLEFKEPRELWKGFSKKYPIIQIKEPLLNVLSSNIN